MSDKQATAETRKVCDLGKVTFDFRPKQPQAPLKTEAAKPAKENGNE